MVEEEPSIIPTSSAINNVPAPTPLLFIWDKSAVHAKSVGLETPVANPNTIAAMTYDSYESTLESNIIDRNNKEAPISMVSRLPIRSESDELKSLTNMVEST